jgi:hypothetical protein
MRRLVHQSARLRQNGHAMKDQITNASGANRVTTQTIIVGAFQSIDESGWIISTKMKLHVAHNTALVTARTFPSKSRALRPGILAVSAAKRDGAGL